MLPLWSDRINIVLSPDKVSLVRYSGVRFASGLQPQVVLSKSSACAALMPDQPLWQPALEAMQKLLVQAGGRADVAVTLSSHFMRYILVPMQADLANEVEEEAYVRFCFTETYGAEAAQWTLRWNGGLAVDGQIASAIDTAFLTGLDQATMTAGLKICAVQPYLMSAFNLVRKYMQAEQQWFVLVEPGSACMGLFVDGECRVLRSVRLDENWMEALPKLLAREIFMTAVSNKSNDLLLCVPQHIDRNALPLQGWNARVFTLNTSSLLQGKFTPAGVVGGASASA